MLKYTVITKQLFVSKALTICYKITRINTNKKHNATYTIFLSQFSYLCHWQYLQVKVIVHALPLNYIMLNF